MKLLLILCAGMGLALQTGYAATIITLDNPSQSGMPGDTLIFTGVVSNDTGTVFLNGDDLNLAEAGLSVDDLFFVNVPVSLDAGENSGDMSYSM